jgi:GNAT superfamily N-acetyltransferase
MVTIERFDGAVDASRLRACYDIAVACWPVDEPGMPVWSLGAFTAKWAQGFDPTPFESWFAADEAGEPAGCYMLRLPDRHNISRADLVLKVPPHRRRLGVGSELLRHAAGRARDAGRTRLKAHAFDDSAGAAFAAAVGASPGIADVSRFLRIDDEVRGRLPGLRREAEAHAAGYEVLAWTGLTADEHLAQVARVHAAIADAPMDAGDEPSVWDGDRLRYLEEVSADHGLVSYIVAARQQATGEIAAVTQIIADPGVTDWGFQEITAVLQEHRGHRLGLLVKVAMLQYLSHQAPGITRIITDNAGSNEYMIAINAQLGFEIGGVSRSWFLDLTAAT